MKIVLNIPAADQQKIEEAAAAMEMNTKDFILGCVQAYLGKNKIPNAVTQRALKESSEGKSLISYDSVGDMIRNLGL